LIRKLSRRLPRGHQRAGKKKKKTTSRNLFALRERKTLTGMKTGALRGKRIKHKGGKEIQGMGGGARETKG